jgi:hypothetical protein
MLTISQIWGLGFMLLAFGMAASGIILDARRWLRRERKNRADAAARRSGLILNGSNKQESDEKAEF